MSRTGSIHPALFSDVWFSVLLMEVLYKAVPERKAYYRKQPFFCWKHIRIVFYVFRLVWNGFAGMDIQKFQFPATPCRKCLEKLPPAVCHTAETGDILHTVITLVAIAVKHSMKSFQELSRISTAASGFIIIQDDLWQVVRS